MSKIVKVKGIAIEMGGQEWIVPPISLRALEQLQERLAHFSGGIDPQSVALVADATHAALRRNYPDISRDDVLDMLDVANMLEVMQAVMDVSGLHRRELHAEDAAPGER